MNWDTVIGLEIHTQLKTKSKLFSTSPTAFGAPANTQTNFVDAGLPGVLPVLNREAVTMAILFGISIDAEINKTSVFERKNYFYPDLPKGYQISQFQKPIVLGGTLKINNIDKVVELERAHLEEDAGKSIHDMHPDYSAIDLNRAGTPLLEIVTTPCMHSAQEAVAFVKTLHQLVRFIGICDGNMQEGSFRVDVNLSLKPHGSETLGTRTEIKNLNSFRFIEQAIAYEQVRHQSILESGGTIHQETRLFCPNTQTTSVMRSKENENDYRYFPDPDLLPVVVSSKDIEAIKASMPDLPQSIEVMIKSKSDLNSEDESFLLSSPKVWELFQATSKETKATDKQVVNWLKSHYAAALNNQGLDFSTLPVTALLVGKLLDKVCDGVLSNNAAKSVFGFLWAGESDINAIIKREGFEQDNDDEALLALITSVIANNPEQVSDFRAGKEKLLGFFVGQVMKESKGKANPAKVNQLLLTALKK